MSKAAAGSGASAERRTPEDETELVDYCWRPKCRREFRHASGPGRRREYCSEMCRRTAEKELRQVRSRLVRFEHLVEQARIEIAAHGRADDDDIAFDTERAAREALARAQGVLAFLSESEDKVAGELKRLVDAVTPLISGS